MALLKNLYLDFGFLNPFKKKDQTSPPPGQPQPIQPIQPNSPLQTRSSNFLDLRPPTPRRGLPVISRRLLESKKDSPNLEPTNTEEPMEIEKSEVKEPEVKMPQVTLPKVPKAVSPPPSMAQLITNNSKNLSEPQKPEVLTNSDPIPEVPVPLPEKSLTNANNPALESFFSSLYSHISKEEAYINSNVPKDVLYKNLMTEMQSFWQDKQEQLRNTTITKAVKEDLMQRIHDLQQMEIEWQTMQLQHEKLKDELASKEIIIENNIRHLKKSFKKIHLNAPINQENYFVLSNGNKLRSLQDLQDQLRIMEADTFNSHVDTNKNDFAAWVRDVMELSDLSQVISMAASKEQMANFIEKWSLAV